MKERPQTKLRPESNQIFYLRAFIVASLLGVAAFVVWAILRPTSQAELFFSDSHDVFMDFYNTVFYSVGRTPYTWGNLSNHNYLPLNYILFYPFTLLNPAYNVGNMTTSYEARENQFLAISCFVYLFASFTLFFYLLGRTMRFDRKYKCILLSLFFLSAPILYCIDRANTIVLSSALVLVFLSTYRSEQKGWCHVGYLCLAVAAALKIFPALFGILLLREKKYKDALITVLYGLAFVIFPFFLLKGNVLDNAFGFAVALAEHAKAHASGSFGVSPAFVGYVLFVLAMAYVFLHKPCDWKLYMVLFSAYFLTSGQQAFYCIILLFYPLVLFLNKTSHEKIDFVYLIVFVLLLMPFQYGFLFPSLGIRNTIISNLLLVALYVWLLAEEVVVQIVTRTHARRLQAEEE